MSMLIADRFVNSPFRPSRSLCPTASGLNVSLLPPHTTFNYPSMHRAIVDVANIKDLASTMYGTRCPRSLARSLAILRSVGDRFLSSSIRHANVVGPSGILYCRVYRVRRSRRHESPRLDISSDRRYRIDSGTRGWRTAISEISLAWKALKCRGAEIKVTGKWARLAMHFESVHLGS